MSEHMQKTVEAYIRLFNAQDAAGIADIYSDDATVTDPVGTPPKEGKVAIKTFYELAVKNGAKLELLGPTRIAGNSAAFPFRCIVGAMTHVDKDIAVSVELPKGGMTIDIIDTFVFNEEGKVTEMKAYWGPDNITQI
ncbi:nuclear transport factor 2 family protein [Hellea balneolensis]|uniref:nuclear transport factor 2 family protein n=1 Tax=Hellea balneolensis TaxID=287478 RepID=UPI000429179C|nr:nuclear transport factor 2 family protein [Hellea balneolensis]